MAPKPSPPSKPFPLPFTQDFDKETISAPPAYWYDQMGAWEVQADPAKPTNHLMRQVSPVWPACWGYSCTGAARQTTIFFRFPDLFALYFILFPELFAPFCLQGR